MAVEARSAQHECGAGATAVNLESECPYAAVSTFPDRLLHVGHVGIVDLACEFLGEQNVPICEMGVESSEHTMRGQRKVRLAVSRPEKEDNRCREDGEFAPRLRPVRSWPSGALAKTPRSGATSVGGDI